MLTVTVDSAPVTEVLSKLLAKLGYLKPVISGIGQELESRVSARFETETETGPLGQHWAS